MDARTEGALDTSVRVGSVIVLQLEECGVEHREC